ncbi:unnamed protein product [Caenorhabditis auriculariae]|uniref:C2H2-type domain-containing protein n=1 Tax=Caenorhabditis auriculariae TaxID=2777116 RepID=A0A8S1H7N6_9PELO|nr:unnamed protein product [Caenorhabditis auriculariae]
MVTTGESIEQNGEQNVEAENGNTTSSDLEQDKIQKLKARIPTPEVADNENEEEGVANRSDSNGSAIRSNGVQDENSSTDAEDRNDREEKMEGVDSGNGTTVADDDEAVPSTSDAKNDENNEEVEMKEDDEAVTNGRADATTSEGAAELPKTNGTAKEASEEPPSTNGAQKRVVECIDLDDDEPVASEEPQAKKAKVDADDDIEDVTPSPAPKAEKKEEDSELKKTEPQLTSPEALLNKLEGYVADAIENEKNVQRKLLDALLGAINLQVQKEPLSVRKLILDKQLVLPNTISFPPSQVVDLLIEHDPEFPLSKVVHKMFGDERPKLSDAEKKERQLLKAHSVVPHMTKILMDIGQDLVQEATYSDIVHARNLPETPKNIDTYKQVAAQLKPVWETLRKKNEPYKMPQLTCQVCGFKSESRLVMMNHRSQTHMKGGKYQCAMCPEYDTNEQRLIQHYLEAHLVIATKEDRDTKQPCYICDEDFVYKGLRDAHMKQCKKDYARVRNIMAPKPEDALTINRWLWDRPPIDPTILQQQQAAQAQAMQKKHQQQQAATQQAQLTAIRQRQQQAAAATSQQTAMLQQQLLQQQRVRQMTQAFMSSNRMINQTQLLAAMQQHIQRTSGAGRGATVPGLGTPIAAASVALLQKQLQQQQQAQAQAQKAAATPPGLGRKSSSTPSAKTPTTSGSPTQCEICDQAVAEKEKYLVHLQTFHKQMIGKSVADMTQGAPLACSRCRDRFWTYEGLERHLVMSHGLVTADLLQKAQKKEDGGRCKLCSKQYAFNMLQHLVADHQVKLCSAEIMYSCDVCSFKCTSYQILEVHLTSKHPKGGAPVADRPQAEKAKDDCITLDD